MRRVVYGASATLFGVLFGLNALGFVVAGQLSAALAGRVAERRTLLAALLLAAGTGIVLILVAATGAGGLATFAMALFGYVFALGLTMPNATSLALEQRPMRRVRPLHCSGSSRR
jgi:DHA1 family bicyclomycin/chloramphenicol resistance-like MFS transporter